MSSPRRQAQFRSVRASPHEQVVRVTACPFSCEQHLQLRCGEAWQGVSRCVCHFLAGCSLVLPVLGGWAAPHPCWGLPVLVRASSVPSHA